MRTNQELSTAERRYRALEYCLNFLEMEARAHGNNYTTVGGARPGYERLFEEDKERLETVREMMREYRYGTKV